jgi:SAM-dependent methyltransferase
MFYNKLSDKILSTPIYTSNDSFSITSISNLINAKTEVYYDKEIAHLYTKETLNLEEYYDNEYKVDIESEDKDSLYGIINGEKVYRTQYQLDLFTKKVEIKNNMKILDYGSAKGLFLKKLIEKISIEPYLFDITTKYKEFWLKTFNQENCSFYNLKDEWKNSLDIVTSFYVFEHVKDPLTELKNIYQVLKEDGTVYIQVPNVYNHIADFICIDHLHHYSKISLTHLLNQSGFEVISIDDTSYEGALIIVGQKKTNIKTYNFLNEDYTFYETKAVEMSKYWQTLSSKINTFYKQNSTKKAALYGAGFYSTYILSHLPKDNNIAYAIDQNPHLHSQKFNNLDVIPIDKVSEDIEVLYVGLNPKMAKEIIKDIKQFNNMTIFYLD